jgi:hypothetical protein
VKTEQGVGRDAVVSDRVEWDDPGPTSHAEVLGEAVVRPVCLVVPVRSYEAIEDLAGRQGKVVSVLIEHRPDLIEESERRPLGPLRIAARRTLVGWRRGRCTLVSC